MQEIRYTFQITETIHNEYGQSRSTESLAGHFLSAAHIEEEIYQIEPNLIYTGTLNHTIMPIQTYNWQ